MRRSNRTLRRQQGSVYILALLVLLILTIVGLALSLVTQSEMQIGVNERLGHQAFHAATSGIDIAMAKALGLTLTAEGIETAAQHQFLLEAGCELGQGFGFARPQDAEAIKQYL